MDACGHYPPAAPTTYLLERAASNFVPKRVTKDFDAALFPFCLVELVLLSLRGTPDPSDSRPPDPSDGGCSTSAGTCSELR